MVLIKLARVIVAPWARFLSRAYCSLAPSILVRFSWQERAWEMLR